MIPPRSCFLFNLPRHRLLVTDDLARYVHQHPRELGLDGFVVAPWDPARDRLLLLALAANVGWTLACWCGPEFVVSFYGRWGDGLRSADRLMTLAGIPHGTRVRFINLRRRTTFAMTKRRFEQHRREHRMRKVTDSARPLRADEWRWIQSAPHDSFEPLDLAS